MEQTRLIVLLATAAVVASASVCSNEKYTNGCSVPFGLPWFYKDEFAAVCNKHDICYACVSIIILMLSFLPLHKFDDFLFHKLCLSTILFCIVYRDLYITSIELIVMLGSR